MEKIEITEAQLVEIIAKIDSGESTQRQEAKKLNMDRTTLGKKILAYKKANPSEQPEANPDEKVENEPLVLTARDQEGNILRTVTIENEPIMIEPEKKKQTPEDIELENVLVGAMKETAKTLEKAEKLKQEKARVREESEKADVEKVTFTMSKELLRAIRVQCSDDDIKIIDFVKDAFYDKVDPAYFKRIKKMGE